MQNPKQLSERETLAIFTAIVPIYCVRFPLLLKVSQIARLLGVNPDTVKKWIDSGQFIPAATPGHYSTPALLYWLIKNEVIPSPIIEDRLAEQIAGEAILSLTKEML